MQPEKGFRGLSFLAILIATIMQLSIIVAYKPIQLVDWFFVPAGIIGFPVVFTLSDVVAEVYGYKRIRRIIWECLASAAIFTLAIVAIIRLPSPLNWHFQSDYNLVFGHVIRVFMAVLVGVMVSAFVNIYLMSKWKIWLKGKYFAVRCFFSNVIGELVITLIADVTGFWGTMPFEQFIHMIVSVYLLKVAYSFIATIPAAFLASFLKKYEGINVYDYGTNFNPFSLKL